MHYYLLTLGCPKNSVDSEGMAMLLAQAGFDGTAVPADAGVLIVNTCGFLEAAEEESLAALRELAAAKHEGQFLIAAGCMAQRHGERIVREVPGVDGLLGTRRWMEVVAFVSRLRGGQAKRTFGRYALPGPGQGASPAAASPGSGPGRAAVALGDPEQPLAGAVPRLPVPGGSAYLKISDGCNAPCAFCSIPAFKGPLRSRPAEDVVAEARSLIARGAQELILIAQDTTAYGRDLGRRDALPELMLELLAAAPELRWLRLMYAYPGNVSSRLIEVMADDPRILHYLDMPLQHGHAAVLRRMRRPSDIQKLLATFARLRAAMPDLALRSTFITGLPGESEAEFAALLDFLEEAQLDKVGVFTYSPEPGTAAAQMPGQVPAAVKEERRRRVMERQQRISLRRNQAQVGRRLQVLVEGPGEFKGRRGPISLARSYRDAPEVDGLVVVTSALPAGEMAEVRIMGALEYDLMAEPVAG